MSISTIYNDFAKDIEKYLQEKLPDMPTATTMEIGAYMSNKLSIMIMDLWGEQIRLDNIEMRRRYRHGTDNK